MAEVIVNQKTRELERVVENLEAENKHLKKRIDELTVDCNYLFEENMTLKQLNRIDDTSTKATLCKDLGSMIKQEIEYCAHDIKSINTIYELNECQPDHAANPVDERAKRLYDKLIALETAGFSHEDAMSLIPIWTDY